MSRVSESSCYFECGELDTLLDILGLDILYSIGYSNLDSRMT